MGISRKSPTDSKQLCGVVHVSYQMGDALPVSVVNFSPEVMVHLAWDGIPDFSAKTCVANVATQIKFLAEAEKLSCLRKILVAGSCSEYGTHSGLCNEAERKPPGSYFSWAKQTLGEYFSIFCREKNIKLLWFRIFYVYGPGQRSAALIPTLLEALRAGKNADIRNLNAANDFIFVDDVVDAFLRGVEQVGTEGILNLGSGRLSKVNEVSKITEQLSSQNMKHSENLIAELSSQERQSGMAADINNAKLTIAWVPKVSLAEGIAKTLEAMS